MANSQDPEFVIFSDVHAHDFKYGASKIPWDRAGGLYNSRLIDTMNALHEMKDYVIKHEIKDVLFAGDMFHVKQRILTVASILIYEFLQELSEHAHVIMIPGNHDFADREGHQHALTPLASDRICVMNGVDYVFSGSDDFTIVTVPYVESPSLTAQMLKEAAALRRSSCDAAPCVLLGHLGFQGAKVGSDYVLVSDKDVTVDDVDSSAFDACFFGHYHQHQKLFKNGWYVGALTQHDWGCKGGARGFLHVTLSPGKTKVVRHETKAPKFILLDATDSGDEDELATQEVRPQDFVQLLTSKVDLATVKSTAQEILGTEHIEVLHVPKDYGDVTLSMKEDHLQPPHLVDGWVEAHEESEEIRVLGQEILAEALEKSL